MNIAFFTENPFYGKLTRTQGGRTDANWLIALNATNIGFNFEPKENYDVGIIIVPKKDPNKAFEFFRNYHSCCQKWAVMQEGPNWMWQDYELPKQFEYLTLLDQVDLIFCHNEQDQSYFQGLFPNQRVETFPSVLIEDSIPEIPYENRSGSIISGNMCSWYGGMDSFIVGQILSDLVYAPSMGRKVQGEELIQGLTHLPYLTWQQWFLELNKRKYGVNLMRTFAAGSFSLACARLKIPCIGFKPLDPQRICFPELTVDVADMKSAIKISKHLNSNSLFYNHCAEAAYKNYMENFHESIFIKKINNILENL